ncbi:hypothetical protein H9P43_009304 [Blastocladiella emersonii ATCC 22665]|nr:hypothetical protein H9P43_009304 [Blastocladiella emersonii ATCC 22665]
MEHMESRLAEIPDSLIDRALYFAVRLHDPNEVDAMRQYTRVLVRGRAPCVHRAIQQHLLSISMDEASATGRLHVLDAWRRSGRALEYTGRAITDAASSYATLDWWRRSDLPLPKCEVDKRVQVFFNGLGQQFVFSCVR